VYLIVTIFFSISALLMIGAGFWVLLFAKQVRLSFLRRYLLLGPWVTFLKANLGLRLRESYLRGKAKNFLGIFLIIAGLVILFGLWKTVGECLIVY
jgi:hypothetical protein